MTIPVGTKVFAESMDPFDIVDFQVDLQDLLEQGENIATAVLTLPTESSLLGLTINTSGGYSTTLISKTLKFYLSVTDSEQSNAVFSAGVILPIEVRVVTDSIPARKKQRTIAVQVVQR